MHSALPIQTSRLTKHYGKVRGVVDLDLSVERAGIFGFLGPNGAGKTTVIRLLLDFIRPTSGSAKLFDLDSRREHLAISRRVGYLPSDPALDDDLTARQFLEFSGRLRGAAPAREIASLAERLDLNLERPVIELSRGDRQKTALIKALMHRPELLILDEPTNGLDPLMQHAFYELLNELRADGCTIFFSSHNLPEVQRLCDRVGIIRSGRLVAVESVADLKRKALRNIEITFDQRVDTAVFRNLRGVESCETTGSLVRLTMTGNVDPLIKAAALYGVVDFRIEQASLEELFLRFYQNTGAADHG